MKTKSILFSGPMVTAILEGRKTMTRRVVNPQPEPHHWEYHKQHRLNVRLLDTADGTVASFQHEFVGVNIEDPNYVKCQYSADMLYVRETWCNADCFYQCHENEEPRCVGYRADNSAIQFNLDCTRSSQVPIEDIEQWNWGAVKWKPSIHMPRWASRLTLKITSIRVERLQDITEEDAAAEGPPHFDSEGNLYYSAKDAFWGLWESINGKPRKDGTDISWDANPWVWVVEFAPIFANVDSVLKG